MRKDILQYIVKNAPKYKPCNEAFIPFKKAVEEGMTTKAYQILLGHIDWPRGRLEAKFDIKEIMRLAKKRGKTYLEDGAIEISYFDKDGDVIKRERRYYFKNGKEKKSKRKRWE